MDIQWVPCRKTNESKRRYNLEIKQEKFAGIVLRGRYLSAVALGGGMKGGGNAFILLVVSGQTSHHL